MKLFNDTVHTLEKSLNYSMAKNRMISHNIANVDTPNYKSKEVVFKKVLNDELMKTNTAKRTHPKHLPFTLNNNEDYRVITNNHRMYNHNRNNVDIDKEMTELAKNQIYYEAMVDRLKGEFSNIQTVLRGGN